jgi:Na+/H+-dicarboxylate symporter
MLLVAATYSVLATTFALRLAPLDAASAAALVGALEAPPQSAPLDMARWLESLIPTNVIAAAAQDAILPLVVFAVVFGFAVARIETPRRAALAGFFQAVADTMIVIIKWVLALAPAGVFGLALALGLDTGFDAVGAIAHYVGVVVGVTCGIIVAAIAIAIAGSGMNPMATLRALAPAQVIAASTQSSLASLPAMLQTALGPLRIRPEIAEFVLPLAVAVFRLTSPVANLAVALFVVHLSGTDPGLMQYAAAIIVAFLVSISSVGLPGQSSFFISVAPICMVLGAPTTVLPLLLAVEVIPDIFRTVGNVTGDLAAAITLNRAERLRMQHRPSN